MVEFLRLCCCYSSYIILTIPVTFGFCTILQVTAKIEPYVFWLLFFPRNWRIAELEIIIVFRLKAFYTLIFPYLSRQLVRSIYLPVYLHFLSIKGSVGFCDRLLESFCKKWNVAGGNFHLILSFFFFFWMMENSIWYFICWENGL